MKDFVVRVYRFGSRKKRSLVGIVETVGEEGRRAFTNLDELWSILSSSKRRIRQKDRSSNDERRKNDDA